MKLPYFWGHNHQVPSTILSTLIFVFLFSFSSSIGSATDWLCTASHATVADHSDRIRATSCHVDGFRSAKAAGGILAPISGIPRRDSRAFPTINLYWAGRGKRGTQQISRLVVLLTHPILVREREKSRFVERVPSNRKDRGPALKGSKRLPR